MQGSIHDVGKLWRVRWRTLVGGALLLCMATGGCTGDDEKINSEKKPAPAVQPSALSNTPPRETSELLFDRSRSTTTDTNVRLSLDDTNTRTDEPARSAEPARQQIFRPSDQRVQHDPTRLAQIGIRQTVSPRLVLVSDIDPGGALPLHSLIDQVYDAWVDYFGPLPPNREGTEFQITGHIFADRGRFESAGLLPLDLPMIEFGRHRGAEFWMHDQEADYYRRHLTIHEATHCFMTIMPGLHPPLWYLEGMAEYFGTHRVESDGTVSFGVFPDSPQNFRSHGRIEIIQQEVAAGSPLTLQQVGLLNDADFARSRSVPYAWSWAVCMFLDSHPRYRDRFRKLAEHLEGRAFARELAQTFVEDRPLLAAEWDEFVRRIDYGYPIDANVFVVEGEVSELDGERTVEVDAARSWQSSGIHVNAGDQIEIEADGTVTLNETTEPWVSEPQGISIEYAAGNPIGRLLVGVVPDDDNRARSGARTFQPVAVDRHLVLPIDEAGTLFFRVNDHGTGLADNEGTYSVTVRQTAR